MVVVGSLLSGMSITVVMPPAAAAFVAVSMPVPQEGLMLLSRKVGLEPSEDAGEASAALDPASPRHAPCQPLRGFSRPAVPAELGQQAYGPRSLFAWRERHHALVSREVNRKMHDSQQHWCMCTSGAGQLLKGMCIPSQFVLPG